MVDDFYALFVNRPEVAGLSEPDLKGREAKMDFREGELREAIRSHLNDPSAHGVGCYAVSADGMSKWGCYDFDAKTSNPAVDASYALQALKRAGLDGVIEVSRSGEGRHVWIFLDRPVPADDLRKCLLLIDEAAALECSEINPKQRVGTDHSKNLGNYVRLPYHARWVPENRMVCLADDGTVMSLVDFVARVPRASADRVLELAGRYYVKPPPRREVPVEPDRRSSKAPTQDAHLIYRGEAVVHEGGFFDGRNNKLNNFANYLAGHPGYRDDIAAAHAFMERVWREQLVQEPDFISLDVCRSMIDRAFQEET